MIGRPFRALKRFSSLVECPDNVTDSRLLPEYCRLYLLVAFIFSIFVDLIPRPFCVAAAATRGNLGETGEILW